MPDEDARSFTHVAPWYDAVMAGVPYEQWVSYIRELLDRFDARPESVLDLACGTGRVSRLLARQGYDVVGVDASASMIEEARRNTSREDVVYVCQRMEDLSLDRPFDFVVSLFDSLNYLTDPRDLERCFARVHTHTSPDGLFIFDMNGVYAFEADLFTQESFGHNRAVEYSWKSHYDPVSRLCHVDMMFRVRKESGFEDFREVHVQRAYPTEQINGFLRNAGFTILAVYDAYTTRPARARSDRIFWIARRPAEEEQP